MIEFIQKSYHEIKKVVDVFFKNPNNISKIEQVSQLVASTFKNENKVLICGNGGSLTDAMHFAEEMTGRFRKNRNPLPVIALADPSHITCTANDFGFSHIFSRGVEAFGKKDDVLIVISTSGNSQNIIKAMKKGEQLDMKTVALLGKDGGKLSGKCDHELIVNAATTDRIQEVHIMILHILAEIVERILFPENYSS